MSGHSHAKTIKRVKEANDAQRGKIFSKVARTISVAVRGGSDPATNPKLRQALEEAKGFNMPKDNIERAIRRGTGKTKEGALEEISYEAFGPGGIAVIIEGITDNKNRTLAEVKHILQKYEGKLAESGSVKWLFEKKGSIVIDIKNQSNIKSDDLELLVIEAGAEDIYRYEDGHTLNIYMKTGDLEKIKKALENQRIKIETASLDWVAKNPIEVSQKDKKNLEKLFEELDENEAIQDVYSNLKI